MEQAWNEPEDLARRYAVPIFRLAYARTGCQADAEDIMQEVFLKLLRSRPVFCDEAHAKAWLLRVTINCANDLFRRPWRRMEGPLPEALPAPEPPDHGEVVEAVLALPAKYRIPVHLYYYEEFSIEEIAALTGRRTGTVKSRLFRARALMRQYMEEEQDAARRS